MNQSAFIFKVILLSLLIAIVIKYICPFLHIQGTNAIAIAAIILPSILMSIFLTIRLNQNQLVE
jgi:predicted membrane chloride channel (bestrophin family)